MMYTNEILDVERSIKQIAENTDRFIRERYTRGEAYNYSLSGDIPVYSDFYYIGTLVYTLKTVYTLGWSKEEAIISDFISEIKKFQNNDGLFFSTYIEKKAFISRIRSSIFAHDLSYLKKDDYRRAETRQCISALSLFNEKTEYFPIQELRKNNELTDYVNSFDWSNPWHAGSHFSHELFFLKKAFELNIISAQEYENNISIAINEVNSLATKNGGWYVGTPSIQLQVNGAMKVLTGFETIGYQEIDELLAKRLIDLCLNNVNDKHACDNFNVIYTLYMARKVVPFYRKDEIILFAINKFMEYIKYYHNDSGGFSFYKNKSDPFYYGAKITKGKDEPDMHGTCLFMWGISIIAEILEVNQGCKLKVVIA